MKFLEKDLEEIIYTSTKEQLQKSGLPFYHTHKKRQLRIGNYGVADLVCFTRPTLEPAHNWFIEPPHIYIYELKKDKISVSALMQSFNYLQGIKSWLDKNGKDYTNYNYTIRLIGSKLDCNGSLCYLPDILCNEAEVCIEYYTYRYDIDGLKFKKEEGYYLTNEGF